MGAALNDPALVQHNDLVEKVEPLQFVGDKQGGAARGRRFSRTVPLKTCATWTPRIRTTASTSWGRKRAK